MKGVFAPAGVTIPRTGTLLKESAIRGVASRGMLCSALRAGPRRRSRGHHRAAGRTRRIGARFVELMGLDDPVIDIKVTPNRADCLGVRGIARDLAAAGLGTLKPLDATPVPGHASQSPIGASTSSDLTAACPLFLGRHIRGVQERAEPGLAAGAG